MWRSRRRGVRLQLLSIDMDTHPLAAWGRLDDEPLPPRVMTVRACVRETRRHAADGMERHDAALGPERGVPLSERSFERMRGFMDDAVGAAGGLYDPHAVIWVARLVRCIYGEPGAQAEAASQLVMRAGLRCLEEQLSAAAASERLRAGETARVSAEYLDAARHGVSLLLPPTLRHIPKPPRERAVPPAPPRLPRRPRRSRRERRRDASA